MPFQVIFSAYAEPPGEIVYFNAGEDQIIVCSPVATLTATVIGDLTGHTFLWTQVSGSSVVFTSPTDQLEVSFSQTNFDNKVFKFTIDPGSAVEQVDYINVYGSPTETIDAVVDGTIASLDDTVILSTLCNFPTTPQPASGTYSSCPDPLLRWNIDTEYSVTEQRLYEDDGSGWTLITTLPATDRTYPIPNIASHYRIDVILDSFSRRVTKQSNVVYLPVNPSDNSMNQVVMSVTEGINSSANSLPNIVSNSYTVDVVTLTLFEVPNSEQVSASVTTLPNTVQSISFSVIERVLSAFEVPNSEQVSASVTTLPNTVQSISFSVQDLSGGDIGG